jgi:hypothetical protein
MSNKIECSLSISPIICDNIDEIPKNRIFDKNMNILNSTRNLFEVERIKNINHQLVDQNMILSNRLNKAISDYQNLISETDKKSGNNIFKQKCNLFLYLIFFVCLFLFLKLIGKDIIGKDSDNCKKINHDHPAFTWKQKCNLFFFNFFCLLIFIFKINRQRHNR